MTDLAVLAAGFGVIPLAAIILYTVTTRVLAYREAAWGFLAGVLGFLGVSHAMAVVLASLASIPAAYAPGWIFASFGFSPIPRALSTFLAGMEATVGLMLLVRGFIPIAAADRGTRWPVWIAIGFIAVSLVHFFVE